MANIETLQRAYDGLTEKLEAMTPERERLRLEYTAAKYAYREYSLQVKVIRDARAEVLARIADATKKPRRVSDAADVLINSVTAAATGGAEEPGV